MKYWLMKAEPDSRVVKGKDVKFSVDDFEKIQIRSIVGVAAIAEVHKEAYPDYTAWDSTHPYFDQKSDESKPTWFMVDLQFKSRVANFVSLALLKQLKAMSYEDIQAQGNDSSSTIHLQYLSAEELAAIKEMPLLTQGRLSVQLVSELAFHGVVKLGENGGWEDSEAPRKTAPAKEKIKKGRKGTKRKASEAGTEPDNDEEEKVSGPSEPEPSRAKKARQKDTTSQNEKPTRQSSRKLDRVTSLLRIATVPKAKTEVVKEGSNSKGDEKKLKTMFPRKGCFKCGNLGHIAENCTAPERLCYNCRQTGHESANCPSPRTVAAKQCYSCGGVGHIQADCPTLRLQAQGKRCYTCGKVGHLASNCRSGSGAGGLAARIDGPFNRGVAPSSGPVICYRCGGSNHIAKNCLADASVVTSYASTRPGGGGRPPKTCYKCGSADHLARDCASATTAEDVIPIV
ncbi:hypothetical protein FRB90_003963 [Tulasnella sp. 427]|nr:hypothetical protein FRB90_003963 [Tulasnella sp. 427]